MDKKSLFIRLMEIAKQLHNKEAALVGAFGKEFPPFVANIQWDIEELTLYKLMGEKEYSHLAMDYYEGRITADELYQRIKK